MHGLHLLADLHHCRCPAANLTDAQALEVFCLDACRRHGLTVVGSRFHQFTNPAGEAAGVTGTVVLAESHLAIHTWPEILAVTLDVYVCNYSGDHSAQARALFREAIDRFQPERENRQEVFRGTPAALIPGIRNTPPSG